MLQSSAFIFLRTSLGQAEVIPVPYKAVHCAPHPLHPNTGMFYNTVSDSDFIFNESGGETNLDVKEGTFVLGFMEDDEKYIGQFQWVCSDINGTQYTDCIELSTPVLLSSIISLHCIPTVVLGIGDIPY